MIKILNYSIYNDSLLDLTTRNKTIINTLNSHSYCLALNDSVFRKALLSSDILLPDGIGIVYASKFLNNKFLKKISGADLHDYLINKANMEASKVFYLGSSSSTLEKIKNKITIECPNIKLATLSPPFKTQFSEFDNSKIIDAINSFNPDYLFVGMTAPKQEKWVYENKDKLDVNTICSIGAVFDFYSGNTKRSHPFWIKMGLEWLPRLIKEPKRLFKRNFVSTPKFILQVLWQKFFKNELFKNIK
jgi:N-acetylglucosaminyldiphosphoundecaprenol N-acetyl-beta-D-mannosaminyltransferase